MKYIYLIVLVVSSFLFLITAPSWVIFGMAAVASFVCLTEEMEENNGEATDNQGERGESDSNS